MKFQTFEIKEFGGLATGAPRGSASLGFRVLDGWTFKGLVGGLTIAPTRRDLFSNNESISRLFVLWDEEVDPPKIVFQSSSRVVKTALWTVSPALVTVTTGSNPGEIMKGWRGKIVFVNFDGVIGYRTSASSYGVKFISYSLSMSNVISAAVVTVTVAGTDGTLTPATWGVDVLPMKAVPVGVDTVYIPARNPTINSPSSNAIITAANEHIEVAWTGADALQVSLTKPGTPKTYYYAGFFKTSPALIFNPPLEGNDYREFLMQFSSRLKAEAIAYRNNRTWAAMNAYRDYDTEVYRTNAQGQESPIPSTTATLYFSMVGMPWTFPAENYITLSITGNITALANLSSALLVFSPSEVWAITGNSDADFVAFKIPGANPGCINPLGVQEWRDAVFYVALDGVYRVTLSGTENVSLPIRDVFLNMGSNPVLSTGIDRFRNEFLLALNGILYVFDLEKNVWATRGAANVVEGGNTVTIAMGALVSSFDGNSSSTATFQTEWLDLDSPEVDKFFRAVRLTMQNDSDFAATVSITPIKFDGTLYPSIPSQTINANSTGVLEFNLPGYNMISRGIALKVAVTGYPGVMIRPALEIDYRPLAQKRRAGS